MLALKLIINNDYISSSSHDFVAHFEARTKIYEIIDNQKISEENMIKRIATILSTDGPAALTSRKLHAWVNTRILVDEALSK